MGRPLYFIDRLTRLVEERRSQLIVGLDPDPRALMPGVESKAGEDTDPSVAASTAVIEHCRVLIDSIGDLCVGVKPQLACFERLGHEGMRALDQVVRIAQDAGLVVIADGKRSDVPHTSVAYAESLLSGIETPWGKIPGLGSDAFTVNPYLGDDSLKPFIDRAESEGAGVFVLVRTSNPGARQIQDLECGGMRVHERVAAMVDNIGRDLIGESGLSSVGAVVGATAPDLIKPLRELMPHTPFLIPGIGAQGGELEEIAHVFESQPAATLVTAARSIVEAHKQHGGDPISAARSEAERIRDSCWRLSNK